MQAHGGVADKQRAPIAQGAAPDAAQRMQPAPADAFDAPEAIPESLLQFVAEGSVAQGHDAVRLRMAERPHHGGAAPRQRQHRQRTLRREPLERTPRERGLGRHVDDDGALAVVVLAHWNPQRAPHRGAGAVGGDQEPCANGDRPAAGIDLGGDRVIASGKRHQLRRRETGESRCGFERLPQRRSESAVLERVPERRDALFPGQDAGRTQAALLADMDRDDRFGFACEGAPQTELFHDPLRTVAKRRGAAIEARLRESRWIVRLDEHGANRNPTERVRERRADRSAADDQDVATVLGGGHAPPLISRSMPSMSLGRSALSTLGPLRVTATSSSMRMPMPRQRLAAPDASGGM